MRILAVSLDLDDTLWPIAPVIEQAEQALEEWLDRHHPEVVRRWPRLAMRQLREDITARKPQLAHDMSALRRLTLEHAFQDCGEDCAAIDAAYDQYFAARNRVRCYADAEPALARLAARLPLASISNGNADLELIGLRGHFHHCIAAREFGQAKPHPEIFLEACQRLGLAPENVLHVGDDPLADVVGARAAGMRAAWLNRRGETWAGTAGADQPHAPDLEFTDLGALADWLDARAH